MRVLEMDDKLDSEVKALLAASDEISAAIQSLTDADMQAILTRRYLAFQTMERIAVEMHYDKTTVQRKHKRALVKVATLCPCLPL